MKTVDILVNYWPILVGLVGLGYFIIKLAIRNAVLEVLDKINKDFVKADFCKTCRNSFERRFELLEEKR